MSPRVSQPARDREARFVVNVRDGEAFEHAVLREAVAGHPSAAEILSVLEPVVERAIRPPGSLHPDLVELDLAERMSRLAESFPTLRGRPGIRPWVPEVMRNQLIEPWPGAGARHALHFVTMVWRNAVTTDFNLRRALDTWDSAHRAAFAAWAARPWWAR